jgi:hypothetical protein
LFVVLPSILLKSSTSQWPEQVCEIVGISYILLRDTSPFAEISQKV